jgi:hypothetical protein
MASLGLYGVISYLVERRTQEMGIRIALGAQSWAVLRLVLTDGIKMAALGVAFGLVPHWINASVERHVVWRKPYRSAYVHRDCVAVDSGSRIRLLSPGAARHQASIH